MIKQEIPELSDVINKHKFAELSKKILSNKDYFKTYNIDSSSKRKSNLLHLALSYKEQELINTLLEEGVDLFSKNKYGMYPVFYTQSMKDFNSLITHEKIKNNNETTNKLKNLLFNDIVSPVYYWKPKQFKEFLKENKEMLSSLNDNSVTFLLNINQLLTVELHEVWESFKEENNITFSNEDIYLFIIDKIKDNKSNNYRTNELTVEENEKLIEFKEYKKSLINLIIDGVHDKEKLKKIPKLKLKHYQDFYLLQTPDYEQVDFLYKEIKKLKDSIKKNKITHIESDIFLDDLLFQWKDYINKEKISDEELKKLCEENGLVGINTSPVFSLEFIKNILNDLKKETFKVFPMQDKKLFANNAYLKISNMFGKNNGYLHYSKDKNVLNINVSDYSHGRENIFADELKDLKNCFVHEYTHYLQVVSEYHYDLNFKTNTDWLKVEDKILRNTQKVENDTLIVKLKKVLKEEFDRNGFDFSSDIKLDKYLDEVFTQSDKKEVKNISIKLLMLCPKHQRSADHKKYMNNNLEFAYECLIQKEHNLQKLYLEKLNKDEYLEDYYNDPVELHARLNEHLIKIKGKELLRDFNFLSEEDNQNNKKLVLNDLRKFNRLILNHFNQLKEKKQNKISI